LVDKYEEDWQTKTLKNILLNKIPEEQMENLIQITQENKINESLEFVIQKNYNLKGIYCINVD
jgi:hypothetical protein